MGIKFTHIDAKYLFCDVLGEVSMVNYNEQSVVNLSGGFGTAKVYKVTETPTGTEFVLKEGTVEQNINSALKTFWANCFEFFFLFIQTY